MRSPFVQGCGLSAQGLGMKVQGLGLWFWSCGLTSWDVGLGFSFRAMLPEHIEDLLILTHLTIC